jgi:hypothetical protein
MALDKATIVEQLSNASVIEIADLVKELESKWGVTAAAGRGRDGWWWRRRWWSCGSGCGCEGHV